MKGELSNVCLAPPADVRAVLLIGRHCSSMVDLPNNSFGVAGDGRSFDRSCSGKHCTTKPCTTASVHLTPNFEECYAL